MDLKRQGRHSKGELAAGKLHGDLKETLEAGAQILWFVCIRVAGDLKPASCCTCRCLWVFIYFVHFYPAKELWVDAP